MRRGVVALLVATLALTASSAAAQAEPPADDPQRLYMRGAAAYGDGRYAEAAQLFERAYALRADAPLLYNLGLALEQAGEVARAIDAYERFLAAVPEATERTEVERSLVTLRRQQSLEDELAHREVAPPPVTAPPPAARPVDPAPWVVVGVGGAALIAGIVTAVLAQQDYDAARTEPEHLRATRLEASANDGALVANVLFVAGGLVAAAGVIWGIVDLASRGDTHAEITLGPGTLGLRGTF